MRFRYVLFDWRGTLFHDESDQDWIRASALSIGRHLSDAEISELAQAFAEAEVDARVAEARQRADCSVELNRAASLLHLRLAGFDAELASAVWERDGDLAATQPYDGGAVSAGITTLLLPPVSYGEPRGLQSVLRLVE